jgi:hypothetical protein
MRNGNVFVTGAVRSEEFEHLINALGVSNLFFSVTRPLFAHPVLSAISKLDLPTAYFDWSRGYVASRKSDLPLDPGYSISDLIGAVIRWMPRQ